MKDCWRPGGEAYDNNTSNNIHTNQGKNSEMGKSKSKQVDVVETNQSSETAPTVSYPSQTPSTIGALSCNSEIEQIMGVTIKSLSSTKRQAGRMSDQVCRTKRYHCLILESTQRVELASNMTEGVWLHSNLQKDGQFECFSTRVRLKNPSSLLVVLYH